MIYLIAAIVSSALVSIIMRLSESYIKNNISMLAVNYAACVLVAGIHMGLPERAFEAMGADAGTGMRIAVALGVINGFLYLFSFILMQMSVRKNGVVLSAVFMKLGVMVPTVTAVIFLGDTDNHSGMRPFDSVSGYPAHTSGKGTGRCYL